VHTVAEKPSEAVPHPSTALAAQIRALPPNEAAALIERTVPTEAVEALMQLNPALVQNILKEMEKGPRRFLTASAPAEVAEQWKRNTQYGEGTIGRLMEAPLAVFRPEMTVGEAIEALRPLVRSAFVTYIYVVDADGHLDLLVGCILRPNCYFRGHGDGKFTDESAKFGFGQRIFNTAGLQLID
jgi:Mg/Co/Ni transporter MgtE